MSDTFLNAIYDLLIFTLRMYKTGEMLDDMLKMTVQVLFEVLVSTYLRENVQEKGMNKILWTSNFN